MKSSGKIEDYPVVSDKLEREANVSLRDVIAAWCILAVIFFLPLLLLGL